jgi:NADH-quinone oxidoreductase subunit J
MDVALFLLFAVIAVACGVNLVVQTHPITSALSLVGVMGSLAVLYLLLGAEFLAAVQVIVYAGAIMVLFVFVIMLLNLSPEDLRENVSRARKVAAGLASAVLFLLLAYAIRSSRVVNGLPEPDLVQPVLVPEIARAGEIEAVGQSLFHSHVLAFEFSTALVLVAIVGAIYLTKKRKSLAVQGRAAPGSVPPASVRTRPASVETSRKEGPA